MPAKHLRSFYIGTGAETADGPPFSLEIIESKVSRRGLIWTVHYFQRSITQLGAVRSITPDGEFALLDACLAFYPQHFRRCNTLRSIEKQLRHQTHLDFRELNNGSKLNDWAQLRSEARSAFESLAVFEGNPKPVVCATVSLSGTHWWSAATDAASRLWRRPRRAA